ncbi:hypothetical protein ACP4OV_019604 [Aristida adscensionis]
MALDQDPMKLLSQKLEGAYHLNAQLQALLGRPLDSRGQEAAMAVSQKLSQVFMESMSMLNLDSSSRVGVVVRTAPETMTGNGVGLSAPTKNKHISGQEFTTLKRGRDEEVMKMEITPSPHKDGYHWRKYGQKNIRNCNFERYYYKCSRDRHCAAKKRVQRLDTSGHDDPPVYEVTYLNHHTCHAQHANDGSSSIIATTRTTGQHYTTTGGAYDDLFPHIVGSAEENEAIVSCLATVINGATADQVAAAAGHSHGSSAADDGKMAMVVDTGLSCDDVPSSSPGCPVEEAAGWWLLDEHMDDVAGFVDDTVWPHYT